MQKSTMAASYLDVIAVSQEKERKDKEKKSKKHSDKKPYSETAEQIQSRRKVPELTDEEIF